MQCILYSINRYGQDASWVFLAHPSPHSFLLLLSSSHRSHVFLYFRPPPTPYFILFFCLSCFIFSISSRLIQTSFFSPCTYSSFLIPTILFTAFTLSSHLLFISSLNIFLLLTQFLLLPIFLIFYYLVPILYYLSLIFYCLFLIYYSLFLISSSLLLILPSF